jgi:hypothetical protein
VGSAEDEDQDTEVSSQAQSPKDWKKKYGSNLGRPRDMDRDNILHPTVRARKQASAHQLVGGVNYIPENKILLERLNQKIPDKVVERNRRNFSYLPEEYLKGTKTTFSL